MRNRSCSWFSGIGRACFLENCQASSNQFRRPQGATPEIGHRRATDASKSMNASL
ncbi:hypothetical protein KIN20_031934 [Parelaphostrongylus tenuis]|uniref:Uncharacterized protein n=1 Tax=Parelaphostrongylus tenuis TaxID=148309 RepID=A0AAD5R7U1_PARTN|nr:hypothetical protein KIN20_031934 [Parelaphostrongylus tenuis]